MTHGEKQCWKAVVTMTGRYNTVSQHPSLAYLTWSYCSFFKLILPWKKDMQHNATLYWRFAHTLGLIKSQTSDTMYTKRCQEKSHWTVFVFFPHRILILYHSIGCSTQCSFWFYTFFSLTSCNGSSMWLSPLSGNTCSVSWHIKQ